MRLYGQKHVSCLLKGCRVWKVYMEPFFMGTKCYAVVYVNLIFMKSKLIHLNDYKLFIYWTVKHCPCSRIHPFFFHLKTNLNLDWSQFNICWTLALLDFSLLLYLINIQLPSVLLGRRGVVSTGKVPMQEVRLPIALPKAPEGDKRALGFNVSYPAWAPSHLRILDPPTPP